MNIKYYGVAVEMSKLTEHGNRADADVDCVLIEQELTL